MIEIFRNPTAPINRVEQRLGAADGGRIINAQAVEGLALGAGRVIEYRGRRYVTMPVGFVDGIRLQEIMARLRSVQSQPSDAAANRELLRFFQEGADYCRDLLRPVGWRGLLWRIGLRRSHDFASIGEADLMALLSGFWLCRTKLSVRSASRHRR